MGLKDLEGKRTGRPRGSKSTPAWVRDLRWTSRNLGNPDAEPPSELARCLLALGREHSDRFLACLAILDGLGPKADQRDREASDRTERQSNPAEGLADRREQNGNRAPRTSGQPLRLRRVSLAEQDVVFLLARYRANLPHDCKVVGCAVDPVRGGVVFTLTSETFPPVTEGEPVPELLPRFAR